MSSHGTYGRYQQHLRRDEEPCEPCRTANREYMKRWRRMTGRTRFKLVPIEDGDAS